MKDFAKVFLLIIGSFLFFIGLALLTKINPFIISMLGILLAVTIIIGGILLLRRRYSHKLPKEQRKEHLKEYKDQFKNKD